jgi:hypothetical protein
VPPAPFPAVENPIRLMTHGHDTARDFLRETRVSGETPTVRFERFVLRDRRQQRA